MIKVRRLNGQEMLINVDMISMVDHHSDTVIHLTDGNKVVTLDSLDTIQKAVIAYKKAIYEKKEPI